MLLADNLPFEQNSFFLLSWFGTFVSSQARYDWIEHQTLVQDKASNRLLFLSLKNEFSASSQLLKRHTSPRALPSFLIIRLEEFQVALRCTKSADSQDFLDHLLTAIPGGSVEMNRLNISHWEKFLLLSSVQLNGLYTILYRRVLKTASNGEHRISLNDGFILRAGPIMFDLRHLQEQKTLDNIFSTNILFDINNNKVELDSMECQL